MNNLCTDVGYLSVNKYGEQLCGDHIETVKPDDDSIVVVLADGMGSGVKANILSTLTSKIISTMMANSMSLEDCVSRRLSLRLTAKPFINPGYHWRKTMCLLPPAMARFMQELGMR